MDKIAVGGGLPDGVVDLDAPVASNLRNLAQAKKCDVSDLVACILDRDRHKELIAKTREAGARIMLISDGDVAGVIATTMPESAIDIYLGSGGAPEGVLAAAALRCVGGQMQGRLMYENDEQIERRAVDGPRRSEACVHLRGDGQGRRDVRRDRRHDRARCCAACAIHGQGAITHSVVMRSRSGTVRYVEAHHNFSTKYLGRLGGTRLMEAGARRRRAAWLAGAGCGASARTASGSASPSAWACRRSSAGCWRRAASGSRRAGDFLDPTLRALLPDPSLLIDMDAAADRLAGAAVRGETVGVFGDYDVDGACSAALMVTLLRDLGCTVHTHVPDRMTEGYGPNPAALRRLAERGATPDRLRRLRHRRGRGAGRGAWRGGRDRAGPPQGGRPAARDAGHGQSEPAG